MRTQVERIFSPKQEFVLHIIMNGVEGETNHKRKNMVDIKKLAKRLDLERQSVMYYVKTINEKAENINKIEEQVKRRKHDIDVEMNKLKNQLDLIEKDLKYVDFLKDFSKLKFT